MSNQAFRALIVAGAVLLAGLAIAAAILATGPRLVETPSGVVDRTHRTDRLKAPARDVRVVSACGDA